MAMALQPNPADVERLPLTARLRDCGRLPPERLHKGKGGGGGDGDEGESGVDGKFGWQRKYGGFVVYSCLLFCCFGVELLRLLPWRVAATTPHHSH